MNQHLKRPLQFFCFALLTGWLLYAYWSYLSNPDWEQLRELLAQAKRLVAPDKTVDILVVLCLWAAADFLGPHIQAMLGK
jgi:hypothetical protein